MATLQVNACITIMAARITLYLKKVWKLVQLDEGT